MAGSVLLRARPRVLLAAVLTLWFLVPAVGNSVITGESGGALGFHAASWLVFSVLAGQLLHDPWSIKDALARHFFVFLVLGVVVAAALLASRTSEAGGGMLLLVDQILAPVLFFLLLIANSARQPGLVKMLRSFLLFLVAIVCLVAVAQWLNGDTLFYGPGYRSQYWFNPETQQRWMGTLDQPLALSLVISVAAPLVAGLKRTWLQALLLVLMVAGVLITQSRVGIAVMGVSLLAVVMLSRRRLWVKAILVALLAVATYFLVTSPLVEGVAARLADDSGSAEARSLALDYFLTRWADYAVAGLGIGSSHRVAVQAGLETSFENPILMYSIDFGILFAVLYFGLMLVLIVRNWAWHDYRGLTLAGILAVVVPQTYSSLATRSVAGIVVWTVLAMVVIAGDEGRARRRVQRTEGGGWQPMRHPGLTAEPAGH